MTISRLDALFSLCQKRINILRLQMTVSLKLCLSTFKCSYIWIKSRENILKLSQKYRKVCLHFQCPVSVKQNFCQSQQTNKTMVDCGPMQLQVSLTPSPPDVTVLLQKNKLRFLGISHYSKFNNNYIIPKSIPAPNLFKKLPTVKLESTDREYRNSSLHRTEPLYSDVWKFRHPVVNAF